MNNLSFQNIPEDWVPLIRKYSTEHKYCIRCKRTFTEIDNIARWNCKQHCVSLKMVPPQGGIWPCCGQINYYGYANTTSGCVSADHSTRYAAFTIYEDIWMPTTVASIVIPYNQHDYSLQFNANALIDIDDPSTNNIDSQIYGADRNIYANFIGVRRFDYDVYIQKQRKMINDKYSPESIKHHYASITSEDDIIKRAYKSSALRM